MARFLSLRLALIAVGCLGGIACTAILGDFDVSSTNGPIDSGGTDTGNDVIADVAAEAQPDSGPKALTGVRLIAAGARHTCALANLGEIFCWGDNSHGQLAQPASVTRLAKPRKVLLTGGGVAKGLVSGGDHVCVIMMNDDIQCWGENACGQTATGDTTTPAQVHIVRASSSPAQKQWAIVAPGVNHTCAVEQGGQTYCWGCNAEKQAGEQTAGPFLLATTAGTEKLGFASIASSKDHTCAATTAASGTKCWGTEAKGALGNGAPANDSTASAQAVNIPIQVKSVVVGGAHSCALDANDDARCWGDNAFGQVGVTPAGSFLDAPGAKIAGTLAIAEIAAGGDTTCGVSSIGRNLACLGSNSNGQLGRGGAKDNSPHPDPAPVQRPGGGGLPLDGVAHVSVGREHVCAIVGTSGEVFCWGNGADGQLGDGTSGGDARTSAVQVALPE